ncbi:MAG: hypothetical protein AABX00_06890 [Nanoarchaeota archaeon]
MNKLNPVFKFAALFLVVIIALMGFHYMKPLFTGFVVNEKENAYVDRIGQEFISSSEYAWQKENNGALKSFKLSGAMENNTAAKIWLESDGIRYLVFDTAKTESISGITGFVVDENGNEINATVNETIDEILINETIEINETINNETISINDLLSHPKGWSFL